jgi:glyoxylase-like metal-dependent hydrolase (beta-lactamase superfamily II)
MSAKIINSATIATKVINKEQLFILDVRNEDEYKEWKIEGEHITSVNIPYFELLDSTEAAVKELPQKGDVLVVCAKEGSSKMIAEIIAEETSREILYLEGGMKKWSEHLERVKVYEDSDIKVYQYIRTGKGCLSYVVVSEDEALAVDPARFIDVYQKDAENEGFNIKHIVDSHLHADHISGGFDMAQNLKADYYIMKSEGVERSVIPLEEKDRIEFKKAVIEVLAVKTPGHTPGSVSFLVNKKVLFSGDTIFVNSLGRPDLGGKADEWAKDLFHSVTTKVSQFSDDVIVLPAHAGEIDKELNDMKYIGDTLGNIRKKLTIMTNKNEKEFTDYILSTITTEQPPNFKEIVAINRGVQEATEEKKQELEIGPNRCALAHS